ncbi:hypothetical protein [Haladaptatus paucihalophilus]|nr:hypothetical protein [Haladaptatus paucihalophilus]SHL21661.1 hypothetical protein SAMN05444342_3303 [Haladaptatus paucihalophilus DX253]
MDVFSLENPWVYSTIIVVLWAGIWGVLSVFVFDGALVAPVITGAAGGLAFALVFQYLRRNEENATGP